jgi:hypothetical protein
MMPYTDDEYGAIVAELRGYVGEHDTMVTAVDVIRAVFSVMDGYTQMSPAKKRESMIRILEGIAAGDDGILGTEDDAIPWHVLETLRMLINLDILPSLMDLLLDLTSVQLGCAATRAIYNCCRGLWPCCWRRQADSEEAQKEPLLPKNMSPDVNATIAGAPMDAPEVQQATAGTDGKASVSAIMPTQLCVGKDEVQAKMIKLHKKSHRELQEYLARHRVPVVKGFEGCYYAIDHHHMLHALDRLGVKDVQVEVRADLSGLAFDEFWRRMHDHGYVWPYDQSGRQLSLMQFVRDLPRDIRGMHDDPYRSLAGIIRKRGAYAKDHTTPFAEFRWANYLRGRVPIDKGHISEAHIAEAIKLARSTAAEAAEGRPEGQAALGHDTEAGGRENAHRQKKTAV